MARINNSETKNPLEAWPALHRQVCRSAVRALLLFVLVGASTARAAPPPPTELFDLLERAAEQGALARWDKQRVAAERDRLRASTWPGATALELQTEGVDSSLDRTPNAIDTVRWAVPLATPGQRRASVEARGAIDTWSESTRALVTWRAGGEIAGFWLDWAATSSRLDHARARLTRLERAVEILAARYEFGEVSGSELRQLRAQRAEDRAIVLDLEIGINGSRQRLERLLGFPVDEPDPQALSRLANWLRSARAPQPAVGAGTTPGDLEREQRLEVEQGLARLAERSAAGPLEVVVELERVPALMNAPSAEAVGLGVRVPLPFGRRVQERRAAARAEAASAEAETERMLAEYETQRLALRAQEEAAARGLAQLAPLVAELQQGQFSLAEQFRLGAITYVVFLDGLARLDQVRLRQIALEEQLVAARIARAALDGRDALLPLAPEQSTDGETPDDR